MKLSSQAGICVEELKELGVTGLMAKKVAASAKQWMENGVAHEDLTVSTPTASTATGTGSSSPNTTSNTASAARPVGNDSGSAPFHTPMERVASALQDGSLPVKRL